MQIMGTLLSLGAPLPLPSMLVKLKLQSKPKKKKLQEGHGGREDGNENISEVPES
jgi:hypothetical protein